MRVLIVGKQSRILAAERVVDALFTTIGCRLEPHGQGSRFPAVMDDLYSGYLAPSRAPVAQRELLEIEAALRQVAVTDVVWSLADLRRGDDAAEPVNHRATNAFEYFVDADGVPLIARLRESVAECLGSKQVLKLTNAGDASKFVYFGFALVVLGLAWLFLGRAFIPNWNVHHLRASMPLWTFGMDFVILGLGFAVAGAFPGVSDWFRRRPAALAALAIVCVIGWLVVCARAGFLPD
jgi:hypothetical protein